MKSIFIIILLALAHSVQAQTVQKSTTPVDDTGSLLTATADSANKDDAPAEAPDVETEPVLVEVEKEDALELQKTADEGIQIQVEKVIGKSGAMNHGGQVKVYSPWPAKPISPAPVGWKFAPAPEGLAPHSTTVKLGSGNTVDLSITPFVLVPVSDGLNAIRIAEPGYDPAQKYAQRDTISAMLQNSTTELEYNENQAAGAIKRLQLLLSSLPKQE